MNWKCTFGFHDMKEVATYPETIGNYGGIFGSFSTKGTVVINICKRNNCKHMKATFITPSSRTSINPQILPDYDELKEM